MQRTPIPQHWLLLSNLGGLYPPVGYMFVVDNDGNYMIDNDENYLIVKIF